LLLVVVVMVVAMVEILLRLLLQRTRPRRSENGGEGKIGIVPTEWLNGNYFCGCGSWLGSERCSRLTTTANKARRKKTGV
jgi:hypothetical protein